MTNSLRQKQLDKRKWLESEKAGQDLSGRMKYCSKCYYFMGTCKANQAQRENLSLCARAYNRMYKNK